MTEEQTKRVPCCSCKELINENAKVCFCCGNYQNNFQYIKYLASVIPICLSIGLFVVSIWQYNEARKEHIKAQEALIQAQKAEKKITDSGKAIAKVLFAQSLLKDSLDSFDVLKYFPILMQKEAKSLMDAIGINDKERQEIIRLYDLLEKWQQLSMQSDQTQPNQSELLKLEKEIEQQINR